MSVYVNNITINAGETFSLPLELTNTDGLPLNLTGYGISSYIRKHPESSVVVAGFGVTVVGLASEGSIQISLASTITETIPEGRYVYDMMAISGAGVKSIVLEGNVLVRAGMTTT